MMSPKSFNVGWPVRMAGACLLAPALPSADIAEKATSNFLYNFDCIISPDSKHLQNQELQIRVVMYVHAYTHYDTNRPLGCSLVLGSDSANDRTESSV